MMPDFILPNDRERVFIMGRTGSGKSVFAVWLLSHANIDEMPWVILDYKQDAYLRSIPYHKTLELGHVPREPGIHIVNVDFKTDDEIVDDYLFSILKRGKCGLFCDEGTNIPQREPRYRGLKAIFAQGRSKRVPAILATQRPAWINQSVVSESDYYAAFHLQKADDRQRAREFMPEHVENRLDDYHSHWYDVKKDAYFHLGPVDEAETFERLSVRLKPKVRLI